MKRGRWKYFVAIFIIGSLLASCQPPKEEMGFSETQDKVEEAKTKAEAAEALGEYQTEAQQAKAQADTAEEHLNLRKLNEAYSTAMMSLKASNEVFRKFYVNRIARLAEQSKRAIEEEVEKDEDSPLKELLPDLDRILDVAEDLQQSEFFEIPPEMLHEDLGITTQTDFIIEKITKAKLESDFSFAPGKYVLAPQGKAYLQQIAEQMIAQVAELQQEFFNKTVILHIKVVGYTDEQPFREGTRLIEELTHGMEDLVPDRGVPRRQFLNQRLSQLRAQSISDDFKEFVEAANHSSFRFTLQEEVIGKGEQIPTGLPEPYPQNDPRRRLCKIYSYVFAR